MNFVLSIPKGKNILEFLQELDGDQALAASAWYFLHRDVVEELIHQAGSWVHTPSLALSDGDFSFALHYGPSRQHIGAIAFRAMPCYDKSYHPIWFTVTNLYLFENSPIHIAFQHPSPLPSEAICLALED